MKSWFNKIRSCFLLSLVVCLPLVIGGSVRAAIPVDLTKPVVAITNLVNGQRITNNTFAVRGRASDNAAVSTVWIQVNQGGWVLANGTNNWNLTLSLSPGSNFISAYAMDTSGNDSATNNVTIDNVVTNQLILEAIGLGTFSPNYSNAWLEVGRNYSITAKPAPGFVFNGWQSLYINIFVIEYMANGTLQVITNEVDQPSAIFTNKPTCIFPMANSASALANSNITNSDTVYSPLTYYTNTGLVATFVDVQRPALTITAPANGLRWSNSVYTIQGRASDNWQVASVQYQVNDTGWNTANGTNDWSATVELTPGNNVIQAYAVDNSGNVSATNTTAIDYVVSAPLELAITGLGSISPNDSNAWLAVGQNYTLTARPATGFVFSNWTGSISSRQPTLNFTMASNLSLTANFVEVTRPLLSIANLANGQRLLNGGFTVQGRASDNWGIATVQYQLNDSGWTNAIGLTNWSATLDLNPGTNVLQVYAQDLAGNYSLTNTLKWDYVVTNQLDLLLSGQGRITPNYSNAWLEIGRNYSMTAIPAAGWIFSDWLDENLNMLTNRATLTFMMQSNLALMAEENLLPAITSQPTSMATVLGNSVAFSVAAIGDGTLDYQWQLNGVNLSGQTGPILSIPSAGAGDAGKYRVIVTSPYGSVTSMTVSLTVGYPPTIVNQPQDISVATGRPASLNVAVTGSGPLSYSWYYIQPETGPLMSYTGSDYYSFSVTNAWAGNAGSTLTIPNVNGAWNDGFFVVVTNIYGSVTSDVASLTVQGPPVILNMTTNVPVYSGGAASLSVSANGSGPLSYQWLLNGSELQGQTNSGILYFQSSYNSDQFRVRVSNPYGSITSSPIKLQAGNIPTSLAGLNFMVYSYDGSSYFLSFGPNTFTEFATDANNICEVGGYSFSPNDSLPWFYANDINQFFTLSLQVETPFSFGDNILLDFVNPAEAFAINSPFLFDSGNGGDGGVGIVITFLKDKSPVQDMAITPKNERVDDSVFEGFLGFNWATLVLQPATNFVPTSWSGHTLRLTANDGSFAAVYALSGTNLTGSLTSSGTSPIMATGNYSAAAWSSMGAVLLLNESQWNNELAPDYLQLQFTNRTAGFFELNYLSIANGDETTVKGDFSWK